MSFIPALCLILSSSPFPDDKVEFNNLDSWLRLEFRFIIVFLCQFNLFLFYYNLYN